MIESMADEAEQGYDVEEILRRRGGRPPLGSAVASVESVRLDPELKRDLLLRAAQEQTSVSAIIRRAIEQYLRASQLAGEVPYGWSRESAADPRIR